MGKGVGVVLVLAGLSASGPPAAAGLTVFSSRADFLEAAGALYLEDFENAPLVGDRDSGGVPMLAFDGLRVRSDPDALKVLDEPFSGNHSTSIFGPRYLSADTESLALSAMLTLEFEPPVFSLGFFIVDLDSFDMGATIEGVTYVIPATGNGGQAYFGVISDGPISEVVLDSLGSENHYSLDDISFPQPPPGIAAGSVPDGTAAGTALSVSTRPDGNLVLSWGSSCTGSDSDFEVYEGTLGDFTSHVAVACATGGALSAVVSPRAGESYYLVVPRNETREGSYGRTGDGSERPRPVSACLLQQIAGCL